MAIQSRPKITPVSLADECYARIKSDILNDNLQWGEQLDVARLAEEFGVSRSPVIKAIERLAHEGLVEILPNKGSYVHVPTQRDIDEVTELRKAMDRLTCELAYAKNRDVLLSALNENEQKLRPYEENHEEIPFSVFLEYDHAYHCIFAELSDNKRLLDLFQVIRHQIELYRTKTYLGPQTQTAIQRHRNILRCLEEDRLAEALEHLEAHAEEVRLDTLLSLSQ